MSIDDFFQSLDKLMNGIRHPINDTAFDSITDINMTMRTFDVRFIDHWHEDIFYTIPFDIAFDPAAITKYITEFDIEEDRKLAAAREARQKITDEAEFQRLKAKLGK